MTQLWQLSWRNIWRQRRRSGLSAGVVALAVFFSLLYSGLIGATANGMYTNITQNTGHLALRVKDYRTAHAFQDTLIPDAAAVKAELAGGAASQIVTVLEVPALLAGENPAARSRGVLLVGRDALPDTLASNTLTAGRLPKDNETDAVALGQTLADALGVQLGDKVDAYAPGGDGVGAGVYRVVGLLSAPDTTAEGKLAYLPLAAAQALAAPNAATRLEVHLPALTHFSDDAQAVTLQRQLAPKISPNYVLETWREANPSLAQMLTLLRPMTMLISALFFILAGLLIINTIYLSLLERTREFGVIIALGAGPSQVTRMMFLESLMLCGLGALIGLLLGLALIGATSKGIPTATLTQGLSMGLPAMIYPSLRPGDIAFALGFTLLTGLQAAWWPSRVASKLEPVEAMRFVA